MCFRLFNVAPETTARFLHLDDPRRNQSPPSRTICPRTQGTAELAGGERRPVTIGATLDQGDATGTTPRRTRSWVAAGVVALAGAATLVAVTALARSPSAAPGAAPNGSQTPGLTDHGGPVLATSRTYALWWGPAAAWPAAVEPGIASLLSGLDSSTLLRVAAQYMRGATVHSAYGGAWRDPSAPPAKVTPAVLGAEVARALGDGALGGAVDPHAVYLVYTSAPPKGGSFCAWHSGASVDGTPVAVAYLPDVAGITGCADPTPSTFSQDPTLATLANDTSHEFMESVTDPQITAWYDQSGREIGDKCVTAYGGVTTLSNGSTWYLQEEWSDAAAGCVAGA